MSWLFPDWKMFSHFPRFSSPSGNPECAKFASLILKADMNYKFLCYHCIMITHAWHFLFWGLFSHYVIPETFLLYVFHFKQLLMLNIFSFMSWTYYLFISPLFIFNYFFKWTITFSKTREKNNWKINVFSQPFQNFACFATDKSH